MIFDMVVHCLFEQSGIFKNEFIDLGYKAYDYDIKNYFGQTDYIIDLFSEIEAAYDNKESIFDNFVPEDLLIAFFPCTRFECQIQLSFKGISFSQSNWSLEKKLEYDIKLHNELNNLYILLSKLVIVCLRKGFRLILENPYTQPHYLTSYWCCEPTLIDLDRRERGDYYKKPTQYFFFNISPKSNFIFEPLDWVDSTRIESPGIQSVNLTVARSLIHRQYANRFIREFIL